MVTRKEDTSSRVARRKYEEKNKELRKEKSANFQTMIPRELFEEISAFFDWKGDNESWLYQRSVSTDGKQIKVPKLLVVTDRNINNPKGRQKTAKNTRKDIKQSVFGLWHTIRTHSYRLIFATLGKAKIAENG